MSSAVQREETSETYLSTGTEGGNALRQLAAERLAAHRTRRAVAEANEALARREQAAAQNAIRMQARRDASRAEVRPHASRIRETVAARYQQTVSYREFLAEEAKRALEKARAEAVVAERSAKAIAAAQQQLLEEIEQWNQPVAKADHAPNGFFTDADAASMPVLEIVRAHDVSAEVEHPVGTKRSRTAHRSAAPELPLEPWTPAHLKVKLHAELDRVLRHEALHTSAPRITEQMAPEELAELDEEIEFRRAPEFADLNLETQAIQANIIEFPRQLVAPRKARPRIAEGPLREEAPVQPQLRIFEVETEQIAAAVDEIHSEAFTPEWQGLLLNAGTSAEPRTHMSPQLEQQLQLNQQFFAAPVSRRVLSIAVDGLCIGSALAGFGACALYIAGDSLRAVPLGILAGSAVGTLLFFMLVYQLLFFTLNDATPGMRIVRIGYCTFNEQNPTRKALRRRIVSTVLAACPLGLGLVWTALDSDSLGWHDRMSHMYPRSY